MEMNAHLPQSYEAMVELEKKATEIQTYVDLKAQLESECVVGGAFWRMKQSHENRAHTKTFCTEMIAQIAMYRYVTNR